MSNKRTIRHRGTPAATLRLEMGLAFTARREALHPQRVAKRNAARAAKQQRTQVSA